MSLAEFPALIVTIAVMGLISFYFGFFGVRLTQTGIILKGGKFTAGGAGTLLLYIIGIGFVLYIINIFIYESLLNRWSPLNPFIIVIEFCIIMIVIYVILYFDIYFRRHAPR